MIKKTTNGNELRLLEGGAKDALLLAMRQGNTNRTIVVGKLEDAWKNFRIKTVVNFTDTAAEDMTSAFNLGISKIRGEIPELSEERLLRGDVDYLRFKKNNPEAVNQANRIGVGVIDDFSTTIKENFKESIIEEFAGLLEGLVSVNKGYNRSMPSISANRIADNHIKVIKHKISELRKVVIKQIDLSEDAIGMSDAEGYLFSGSKAISRYINDETEKLKNRGKDPESSGLPNEPQ